MNLYQLTIAFGRSSHTIIILANEHTTELGEHVFRLDGSAVAWVPTKIVIGIKLF